MTTKPESAPILLLTIGGDCPKFAPTSEQDGAIPLSRILLLTVALAVAGASWRTARARAATPDGELSVETFDELQQQIRPQPGESRWLDIPWFLDLHAARQKAAAEGKPLFVYSGGGATGIGPC